MSKFIAISATIAAVALVGGTYAITKLKTPTMAQCGATAVAGEVIGGPLELIDKTGKTVTDTDFVTEPTLIYFGYTFCPDVCPLDMARNAAAVDILAERGVDATPVFITIDPARDTPEIVGEYADNFHEKMIGLTGSAAQVDAASKTYRTLYSKQGDEFFRQVDSPEEVADRVACFAAAS